MEKRCDFVHTTMMTYFPPSGDEENYSRPANECSEASSGDSCKISENERIADK